MDQHIRKINHCLVYGWLLIVAILSISYSLEVIKGERDFSYLLIFILITALPAVIVLIRYLRKPDRYSLRYEYIIGYFVMYVFVMITGSTTMVFSYILPMLSLLVLFHQPAIILYTGIASLILNIISIWMRWQRGDLTINNSKDAEIQIALIILCFLGCWLAAGIYDEIQRKNEEYTKQLQKQNEDIRKMTMQTIMTIANTIDAKDEYTRGHSRRVAEYAYAIAKELGLPPKETDDIHSIGLLHDIGKIGIPDAVLNKPGKLTNEEYQLMKSHTVVGARILKDIGLIDGLDIGAKYHHERYDGKGYPEGISGENIPLLARIIAVADAYDAMSSNRIYRRHLSEERIQHELENGCGTQWDARCTEALLKLIHEDRLPQVNIDTDTEMVQQATVILSRVIDAAGAANDTKSAADELTGAYDRETGMEIIQHMIEQQGNGYLLLFDIDHFRHINETEGFKTGDACIIVLAEEIRHTADNCILTRYGADEFMAYIPESDAGGSIQDTVDHFFENLEERVRSDPQYAQLSVSIGIAEVSTEKDKMSFLYNHADKALYVAKQKGGNTYYCHKAELYEDDRDEKTTVDLDDLVSHIKDKTFYRGGFQADYPEFGRMYEFVNGMADRVHQNVLALLFTVESVSGVKSRVTDRDQVMEYLEKAISLSIRTVDVMTRYSSTQYAVILMNLTMENTEIVTNRIMTEFLKMYDKQDFYVHYDAAELRQS